MPRDTNKFLNDFDLEAFDPEALVEEAISANMDAAVFNQIDERDVPWAKNWLEWCMGKQFLNLIPFPRQIQLCLDLFSDYCPDCSDNRYIEEMFDEPIPEIMDHVQMLEFGVCPKCKKTRTEFFREGKFYPKNELAVCAGMRSGKTVSVSLIATYVLHKFLRLPSPARYYGQLDNQTFYMTFVALTAGQCYDTLWQAFNDRVESGPWFEFYHKYLNEEASRLGIDKVVDHKDSFLSYAHKRLVCYYSGAHTRTIRGRTRFFTAIDEIGWFDSDAESQKVKANAFGVRAALEKSLRTIRSGAMRIRQGGNDHDVPDGIEANISSPSAGNDAIMTLVREGRHKKNAVTAHYATWEFNPQVPLESLKDEMQNKITFERDYAAIPRLGANQFIGDERSAEKAIGKTANIIRWKKHYFTDDFGDKTAYLAAELPKLTDHRARILTVDTGFTSNSFALAVMSYNNTEQTVEVEGVIECVPETDRSTGDRTNVHFPKMFDHSIVPIMQKLNVVMVVYDRWNSLDHIQRIRTEYRIKAEQYSLKFDDFYQFRSDFLGYDVRFPKSERPFSEIKDLNLSTAEKAHDSPVTHLILQTLTVREMGRRIAKPLNGTDDLFRCMVLGHTFIQDPKNKDIFKIDVNARRSSTKKVLGVVQGHGSSSLYGNGGSPGSSGAGVLRTKG